MSVAEQEFKAEQDALVEMSRKFYLAYGELTKKVSPEYWRLTGHNMHSIEEISNNIKRLEPIKEEVVLQEWMKKEIEKEVACDF